MVRRAVTVVAGALVLAACSGWSDLATVDGVAAPRVVDAAPTGLVATAPTTTAPTTTDDPAVDRADDAIDDADDALDVEAAAPATTVPVPEPLADPPGSAPETNEGCTVTVAEGETLRAIAARFDDETIDLTSIVVENALTSTDVEPGTLLDICPGNGIDDVTGDERVDETVAHTGVEAQQAHLNTLFAGYGIAELQVDGDAGPVTRQRLCAARLALGLPTSTAPMEPGSIEEQLLFATDTLSIPDTSALRSDRWILIDRTCQIMFVGEGADHLQFVFPTSTGQAAFPTRTQDLTPAYRYNPASHNNGWHNSTTYPASNDNPLNGNMYKPLYFDGGQAIHGANNVPRSPASHGCARLRVGDQDTLLDWLGLGGLRDPIASESRISVTVNVQGAWAGN